MAGLSRKKVARHVATELASGGNRQDIVRKLAAFLVEHKRQHDVEFLVSDIAAELDKRGTHALVSVTTARPLSPTEKSDVIDFIKKREGVTSVELNERVEPNIIGGIIIETPSARYDRSIRRSIEQLSNV